MLYFVLDFLFVFCFARLCAFIRLFPYYSSIQLLSCKCVCLLYFCVLCSSSLYFKGPSQHRCDTISNGHCTHTRFKWCEYCDMDVCIEKHSSCFNGIGPADCIQMLFYTESRCSDMIKRNSWSKRIMRYYSTYGISYTSRCDHTKIKPVVCQQTQLLVQNTIQHISNYVTYVNWMHCGF